MRFLHTMLRVGNLEKSIRFYTEIFGMTLLRKKDYPDGKFTLAFIGYGDESENTAIELTGTPNNMTSVMVLVTLRLRLMMSMKPPRTFENKAGKLFVTRDQ